MFYGLTRLSRLTKQVILLSLDVLLAPLAFVVSMGVASGSIPALTVIAHEWPAILILTVAAGAMSHMLALPRVQLKSYEISSVGLSAILATALAGILAILILSGASRVEGGVVIILALIYLVFSAASRLILLQILLALYRRNGPETRVLIYGAGMTGIQLAMALKSSTDVRLVGFIDDSTVLHNMSVAGQTVYPAKRIESLIAELSVDKVLLAMPSLSPPRRAQIARRVARFKVEVQMLPSFAQLIGEEAIVDKLAPVLPHKVLGRKHLDDALQGGCAAYDGRTILITGAGGSIGSQLCRQLLSCNPRKLVLLDIGEHALFLFERELIALAEGTRTKIVPVLGSVTDARLVNALIRDHGVQVVLHAAAYKHVSMVQRNAIAGVVNNLFGTQTVAQAALDNGIERFVLISTDKAVRPVGMMGATKRLAEIVVGDLARRSPKTIFAMTRFGNVLGSSGSVVPIFHEQLDRGGPLTLTDPNVTRYFMTVQEACKLVLWAGTLAQGGEIFVLDMGKPVRIGDLARQIIENAGYSVRNADNPNGDIEIVNTGLLHGEKLHEELTLTATLGPTAHPKLFRAHERILSEFEIARALQSLRNTADRGDARAIVDDVMHWVKRDIDGNVDAAVIEGDA